MKKKKVFKMEKALTPIKANKVPQHPYMAPNNRSNIHCDAYMSDSYTCSGPLGKGYQGEIYTNRYAFAGDNNERESEICATTTFNKIGQIIALGNRLYSDPGTGENVLIHELLLLDPTTLSILASYKLPSGGSGSSSFGCAGYFYLDQLYRVVAGQSDCLIGVYEVKYSDGRYSFEPVGQYDPALPDNSSIISVLPDWSGRLWVVTEEGYVAFVNPNTSETGYYKLPGYGTAKTESIENSFAVDETGGVFIASDYAMYRFDYDPTQENKIAVTWRESYDRGNRIKPGQKSQGTGTTPTLQDIDGVSYVSITDNADPQMHVLVYHRETGKLIGQVPVFTKFKSCTENSLIGVGCYFIVENNYGYDGTLETPPSAQTTPGVASIKATPSYANLVWDNETLSIPSLVTKASVPDGLIYTYSLQETDGIANWYFTALDFYTGEVLFQQQIGTEGDYDNYYSAIVLHPTTGDAYVPVWGGIVKISRHK